MLNGNTQTVNRIDPEFGGVTAMIPLGVGSNPSSIAVGKDAAWVANSGAGTLVRIDAETNAATCPEPGEPVIHDVGGTTSDARWFARAEVAGLPMSSSWRGLAALSEAHSDTP